MQSTKVNQIKSDLLLTVDQLENKVKRDIQQVINKTNESELGFKNTISDLLNSILQNNWERLQGILELYSSEKTNQQIDSLKNLTEKKGYVAKQEKVEVNKVQERPKQTQTSVQSQPQPQQKSGGFFGKLLPFVGKKKEQGNFTPMFLPQKQQKFVFNKQLNRYMFEGQQIVEEAAPPPPPKKQQMKKTNDMKPKSQRDEMMAPPSVSFRRNKKGGKQKNQVQQVVSIIPEQPLILQSVSFETLKNKLDQLFNSVNSSTFQIPVATTNLPIQENKDQNQLQEQIFQLMKQSYEMLLKTNQWKPIPPPEIIRSHNETQQFNSQEIEQLKKTVCQLQNQLNQNHGKLRSLSELDFQRKHSLEQKDHNLKQKSEILIQTEKQLYQYKQKLQSQTQVVMRLEQQVSKKQEYQQKLTSTQDEISKLKDQIAGKDYIIKLLQDNDIMYKQSIDAIHRQKTLITNVDECLQQEMALIQRIRSKQQKLLANPQQNQKHESCPVSSRGFLQMVDLFDKIAKHTHSTLNTSHAANQSLTNQAASLKDKLQTQRNQYESKINNLKNIVTKQKATLDSFKIDNNDSNQKLQSLKRDKIKLQKQIQRIKHDASFGKGLLQQSNNKYMLVSKKSQTQVIQIQNLKAQLQQLRNSSSEAQIRNNQLTQLVTEMDKEKSLFEQRIRQLQYQLQQQTQIQQSLSQANQLLIEQTNKLSIANGNILNLQSQLLEKDNQIKQFTEQSEQTTQLIQELDKQLNLKNGSITQLENKWNEEKENMNLILLQAQQKIQQLQQSIISIKNQYQNQLFQQTNLRSQYQQQNKQLQQSLQQKCAQLSSLTEIIQTLQKQMQNQKQISADLKNQLQSALSRQVLSQQTTQKINDYQLLISELQSNIQTLQSTIVQSTKQNNQYITEINNQLHKSNAKNNQLQEEYQSTKQNSKTLKTEIISLQQQNNRLKQQLIILKTQQTQLKSTTDKQQELNNELQQRSELINALEQEIQSLQAEITMLQSESEIHKQEILKLKQEIVENSSLKQSTIPIQQLNKLQEKIGEQQFEFEQTKTFYSQKLEQCELKIGQLLEEKLINNSSLAEINNKYQIEIQNEKDNNGIIIGQLRLEKKQLEAVIIGLEEKNRVAEKEVIELLQALEEVNKEKQVHKQVDIQNGLEIEKKSEVAGKLQKELEASNLMISELNEFVKSMKEREAVLQDKIKSLEIQTLNPKQTQLKRLNEKIQSLNQQNDQLLKQKIELLRNNDDLVAKLTEIPVPILKQPTIQSNTKISTTQQPITEQKSIKDIDSQKELNKSTHIPETKQILAPKIVQQKRSGLMSALSSIFLTSGEQK